MVPFGGSRWIAAAPGDRITTSLLLCQLSVAPVATEAGPRVSLPVPENTWLTAAGNRRGGFGDRAVRRDELGPVALVLRVTELLVVFGSDRGARLAALLPTDRAPAPATVLAGAGVAAAGVVGRPDPVGLAAAVSVKAR